MFARDLYGILKTTAEDFLFELIKMDMLPSGRVESAATRASIRTDPSGDGSFSVSYRTTASGFYTIKGTLTQTGGLLATFYNSRLFQMMPSFDPASGKLLPLVSPIVCTFVNWERTGAPSLDTCIRPPGTDFSKYMSAPLLSAKFAGFIQPLFSETYTLSLISSDYVSIYVDGLRIANKTSILSGNHVQVDGTVSLRAMEVYPIRIEFIRDGSLNFSVVIMWKSQSQVHEILPSRRM